MARVTRGSLRLLLLQARRHDDPALREERETFALRTGLPVERIEPCNLLDGAPSSAEVRRRDVLMVGGSGEFYVSKGDLPHQEATFELLREVCAAGHPTFASCFGFQLLVCALGGQIIHDPEGTEVGTYELRLTAEGRDDPLFGTLPPVFRAQLGRKDRASRLPDEIPNLAASERSPFQAFRLPRLPIWASQFHPELDREQNRGRFQRYMELYGSRLTAAEREAALGCFDHSPEALTLIPRFLSLVFG